jgi:hypothetical protein
MFERSSDRSRLEPAARLAGPPGPIVRVTRAAPRAARVVSMYCARQAQIRACLPMLASAVGAPALPARIGMFALPGLPPLPARRRPGSPHRRAAHRPGSGGQCHPGLYELEEILINAWVALASSSERAARAEHVRRS